MRKVGTRRRVGGITVFATDGEAGPPRIAFVAGRSVGNAVRRNRAKRRLREVLRFLAVPEGRDYVVLATPAVVDAPFQVLMTWAQRALNEEERASG